MLIAPQHHRPKPLQKKDATVVYVVTGIFAVVIAVGWVVTVKDVLKSGVIGVQDGYGSIVQTGEDLKTTTFESRQDLVETVSDIKSSFENSLDTITQTQAVLDDVVATMQEGVENGGVQSQTEEEKVINQVIELTQQQLQQEEE